jgi:uncharacterized protein
MALYRTALLALLVGAAPAAAGDTPAAVRSLAEMRQETVVMQEWDLSCGAAALTTVLRYQFGEAVGEREVATGLMQREAYVDNPVLVNLREGFSLLDLKRFVDGRGYEGIGLGQMTLEGLLARVPAIVPIRTHGYNHFVVVRGMARDRILMADPAWGSRTMTRGDFERAWIDYGQLGHVAFVVTDDGDIALPGELAASAEDFFTFN